MKVYVAERGCYENCHVAGIFDSPERAMAAMPGAKWRKTTWTNHPNWPDRSVVHHYVTWDNNLDWDSAVTITELELTTEGPLKEPHEKVVQTYRSSDGSWDYLPEL